MEHILALNNQQTNNIHELFGVPQEANQVLQQFIHELFETCIEKNDPILFNFLVTRDDINLNTHSLSPGYGNPYKEKLIHFAIRHNRPQFVQSLIDHGDVLNAVDAEGATPFLTAAGYGHTEIMELLLANGADINEVLPPSLAPLRSSHYYQFAYFNVGPGDNALLLSLRNRHYSAFIRLLSDESQELSEECLVHCANVFVWSSPDSNPSMMKLENKAENLAFANSLFVSAPVNALLEERRTAFMEALNHAWDSNIFN
jgi:ankyrin repeat protein